MLQQGKLCHKLSGASCAMAQLTSFTLFRCYTEIIDGNEFRSVFHKEIASKMRSHTQVLVHSHYRHLETILKALADQGLKISPSKAKLFCTKVVYMGLEIVIRKNQQGIRPLCDRTEAIHKLPRPTTKRQLKFYW